MFQLSFSGLSNDLPNGPFDCFSTVALEQTLLFKDTNTSHSKTSRAKAAASPPVGPAEDLRNNPVIKTANFYSLDFVLSGRLPRSQSGKE